MKKIIISSLIVIAFFIISTTVFKNFTIDPFQEKRLVKKTIEKVDSIPISTYQSNIYYHKLLFPYDLIKGEPNWGLIITKSDKFLTKEDIHNKNLYYKCKDLGIDINKNNSFFIIETKAKAGFILDEYIKNPISDYNYETRNIILNTPDIKLLSMEIVDNLQDKNYPDINITPKEWQALIDMVLPDIEKEILSMGILDKSCDRSKKFLENLYITIGWEKVDFK